MVPSFGHYVHISERPVLAASSTDHREAIIVARQMTALPPEATVRKKFGVRFP